MFDFKLFRKKMGLSQKEMMAILNLSQATYSRIETGAFTPSSQKYAEYLQKIKWKFPNLDPEDYAKAEREGVEITQNNVTGPNYVGRLERQSDEDRLNLQQVVETLRNELAEKNKQIRTLLDIIDKLSKTR